ncbi:hypothetical protein MVEN_01356400 [Mycena venus]|uniref:Uncharacterized protein n=1 Tax=Mycena venus TaxID=2733690 RepID=A0A8H6XY86_9AGAR|nr:hypothetical protein MVEN_01356400 [Mycena venus]
MCQVRYKRGHCFASICNPVSFPFTMFITLIAVALFFPLIHAAATLKPGIYHLVNLGHPYAPASFNSENRVVLPEDFSGDYDLVWFFCFFPVPTMLSFHIQWEVVAPSVKTAGITIQNLRGKKYARISPPAEGQFVSTGSHPTAFSTVLSGTADFPGDDGIIPDTHLDYWTIGAPGGLVWTYNISAGPEVSFASFERS